MKDPGCRSFFGGRLWLVKNGSGMSVHVYGSPPFDKHYAVILWKKHMTYLPGKSRIQIIKP